ncbi:TetR/AcrR family transcriptional regulator (plasmid) [Streptomyces sp. BI20]|uniref:TetR/AcrR family transcriptional regulator n=1 Tax=Streptomyces sp. BI20 TaxID=3403460 RepID=UPI003C781952
MGRPRGFDEDAVVDAAVELFAERTYEGVSVDELVSRLGVHRNSLYKTFGSKRGLYLTALRRALTRDVEPLTAHVLRLRADGTPDALREVLVEAVCGTGLDPLLLAAIELAPEDPEVATLVNGALDELDRAVALAVETGSGAGEGPAHGFTLSAVLLGLRARGRAGAPPETLAAGLTAALAGTPRSTP